MTADRYGDVIDSRDVIETVEELRAEMVEAIRETAGDDSESLADAADAMTAGDLAAHVAARFPAIASDYVETVDDLAFWAEFAAQGEAFSDWTYGVACVRDDAFEAYARSFAEEIGAIDDDARWPATCIDWTEAAEALQGDYSSIDVDGSTWWAR